MKPQRPARHPSLRWSLRWELLLLGVVGPSLIFFVTVLAGQLWQSHPPFSAQDLPAYFKLPPFSVTDQLGREITLEQLKGKVVVANFIFTNCTAFCPTLLTPRMKELHDRLSSEGMAGRRVVLLSFSVDPEQDTPEKLREYAESYGADPEVWHFLTGGKEEIQRLVAEGFKLGLQKLPQSLEHTHPDGSVHTHEYDVAHPNRFALVDGLGRVRAYYNAVYDWDLEKVLKDIRKLTSPAK